MKLFYVFIISLFFFYNNVQSSAINDIDQDPFLRTWLFLGPFNDYETSKRISDSLSNSTIDQIIQYAKSNDQIKDFLIKSSAESGIHSIHQYYFDDNDKYIIGFSNVYSQNRVNVFYNHYLNNWDSDFSFYLNDEILFENSKESWPWKAITLNKGESRARLIYKNKPNIISIAGWNYNTFGSGLFKESFTTIIKGQIKNKKFNYDKTKIIVSDKTNFIKEVSPDKSGRFLIRIWEKVNEIKISASNQDHKYNKTYKDIKVGQNNNISFFLSKHNSEISGKVVTLYKDLPQGDVLVSLVKNETDIIVDKVFSDNSGKFIFTKIEEGQYKIKVNVRGKQYHALNNEDNYKIFTIGKSLDEIKNIIIKAPLIDKGSWQETNFIDGLKSNYLLDVFVDSKNKIWYGCHTGLSVFDGTKFHNFDEKDGLPSQTITKIFEDSKGQVWILSNHAWSDGGGISKIDQNYNIINFNLKNDIPNYGFTEITEDQDGNILIGGPFGLFIYDGSEIIHLKYGDGIGTGIVRDIYVDSNNNYWIGTSGGLVFYNGISFQNYGNFDGLGGSSSIRKIGKSPSGELIVSAGWGWEPFNGHSLFSFNGFSFSPIEYAKFHTNINDFIFEDNHLIYNTGNRLVTANENYQQSISPLNSLNKSIPLNVMSIYKNSDGIIFTTTWGSGAFSYNDKNIRTFTEVDGHTNRQWGSSAILDNNNNVWMTNATGLAKIKNQNIIQVYDNKNGLPSNDIRDLVLDNFGNIWGTSSNGIFSINNDNVIVYDEIFNSSKRNFSRISISKSGTIWTLGDGYLCSFDGEKVNYYESDSLIITGGNSGLLPLDDGNVLFGGSGLRMLIVEENSFKFKTIDSAGWVNGIAYTRDKNIIYSNANELIVMKDFKKVETHNLENGFIFDVPTTVNIDHRGWIW